MNPLDWLALSLGLVTLLGGNLEGSDFDHELHRPTAGQVAGQPQPTAAVTIGGDVLLRFADSGVHAAEERARETRMNIRRAVEHFALPAGYFGAGLRASGGQDVAEIHYMDFRLVMATRADAKANGFADARQLADRWRGDLDRALKAVPKPLPDGWIGSAGRISGAVLVSDETLARAAAACIDPAPGRRVRVSAASGVIVLEGEVATAQDKARLARLMRDLPGCRGVDDRVAVGR